MEVNSEVGSLEAVRVEERPVGGLDPQIMVRSNQIKEGQGGREQRMEKSPSEMTAPCPALPDTSVHGSGAGAVFGDSCLGGTCVHRESRLRLPRSLFLTSASDQPPPNVLASLAKNFDLEAFD